MRMALRTAWNCLDYRSARKSRQNPIRPRGNSRRSGSGRRALNKYPLVTLDSLDLNVRKITVSDQTQSQGVPIVLSNVRLRNLARLIWLGRDPEENPPTQLELIGRVDPIIDQFKLETHVTPFYRTKTAALDLTVSGIHGRGITQIAPDLARQIDGGDLNDGQFHAGAMLAVKLNTLDPANFDLSRGGKMDVSLKDVAFHAQPAGPVLAGVGEVQSEGIILAPGMTGMDIHELEVDNLVGRVQRREDGLHVLGLVIKTKTNPPASSARPKIGANPRRRSSGKQFAGK